MMGDFDNDFEYLSTLLTKHHPVIHASVYEYYTANDWGQSTNMPSSGLIFGCD